MTESQYSQPAQLSETVAAAMRKAFNLGQTYWQQADSESYSQNAKSDITRSKFDALVEETTAAVAAIQAPEGGAPLPSRIGELLAALASSDDPAMRARLAFELNGLLKARAALAAQPQQAVAYVNAHELKHISADFEPTISKEPVSDADVALYLGAPATDFAALEREHLGDPGAKTGIYHPDNRPSPAEGDGPLTDERIDAIVDRHFRHKSHPDSYAALRETIKAAITASTETLQAHIRSLSREAWEWSKALEAVTSRQQPRNIIALPPLPHTDDRERIYAGHGNETLVERYSATHMREYARQAVHEAEEAWQARAAQPQPKGTTLSESAAQALVKRFEVVADQFGGLFHSYQGKAMPDDVYARFCRLRDERLPALRAELVAALSAQAPAPAHAGKPNGFNFDHLTEEVSLSYEEIPAPAVKAEPAGFTEAHATYVARWGGNCRDCADENGVCPNSGLPCGGADKAIGHVFKALAYGVKHGYIGNPLAAVGAEPIGHEPAAEDYASGFRDGWIDCRRTMAGFVEPDSAVVAMSIRGNWKPSLGPDPDRPAASKPPVHPMGEQP